MGASQFVRFLSDLLIWPAAPTFGDVKVDGDVLLTLSLAKLYGHHANFAGTPRQAIADGYSAVDAVFTALLRQGGHKQSKNHKHKLDLVREHFPNVFDALVITSGNATVHMPGTDWDSLEEYYGEWLASRYDNFEMSAAMASSRIREALNVINAAIRHIAKKEGMAADDLEKIVSSKSFGFDFLAVAVSVGDAHDRLFAAAETVGEERGSKLGTKFAATTNYSELDVMTGDELTQGIIRDDKEIAEEAARIYHAFVDLIDRIQEKRLHVISGGKDPSKYTPDEIAKAPDFMFSMKVRYHGGTALELGTRWFGRLTKGLTEVLKKIKLA
jgi:hypothetical protein